MIRSLHHMAFRCRNSEETRAFYEDVVGLELAAALRLGKTKTGRPEQALHTFFRMRDGAFLAFFEVPGAPFEFRPRHDFDLHIALETDQDSQDRVLDLARRRGLETRGPSDHGFIRSIYLRDPNGYVVELAVPTPDHDAILSNRQADVREVLRVWSRDLAPSRQSELFNPPQTQGENTMSSKAPIFVPAGAGETLRILGSVHTNKVVPAETGGAFAALEISVPPRCGPPMHSHAQDCEFFYVLEGELTFEHPDGAIRGKPGDFCFLPRGGSHAFRNDGQTMARALVVIAPGIEAHSFFKEVDARLAGEVDVPVVVDVASRNGIVFADPVPA